jgi:hypothetical protein
MSDLYETDVYTWSIQQADALRRRSASEVDWDNVAEEIESVGKAQARELARRYAVLLGRLLRWRFEPQGRSRAWEAAVTTERRMIVQHLEEAPSLKGRRDALFGQSYGIARLDASGKADLPLTTFPETNPFTLAQAMDEAFWPEPPGNGK